MPFDTPRELPAHWEDFLSDVDQHLTESVDVHCLGGFVVTVFSSTRSTGDLDCIETVPDSAARRLQEIAGEGSALRTSTPSISSVWASHACLPDISSGWSKSIQVSFDAFAFWCSILTT